ncbi:MULTISPECIES: transposase [unclassified Streptomyces]|uniref:transposase n=1 Tax=unclassified Streptomyces TaxID=2593676 RepID=UPI001331830D
MLEEQVSAHLLAHLDAEIYLSMPGIGEITDARVLAEFGDDPTRYTSAKARKNYASISLVTRASGEAHTVHAQHVRNGRLADALPKQAISATKASPGARRYHEKRRACDASHNPTLRQLGNRLVGTLHGCLKIKPFTARAPPGHTAQRSLTPHDIEAAWDVRPQQLTSGGRSENIVYWSFR